MLALTSCYPIREFTRNTTPERAPGHPRQEDKVDIDCDPMQTRIRAEIDSGSAGAPQPKPRPPSPALHFAEVQSFFSDDSSNKEPRGSLRQRLSQFKAITSRAGSVDDIRTSERRQALAQGKLRIGRRRSICKDEYSNSLSGGTGEDMSKLRYARFRMGRKVKKWWHLGEGKIRHLGGKIRRGKRQSQSAAGLYAGV